MVTMIRAWQLYTMPWLGSKFQFLQLLLSLEKLIFALKIMQESPLEVTKGDVEFNKRRMLLGEMKATLNWIRVGERVMWVMDASFNAKKLEELYITNFHASHKCNREY
jgi:hypothetical protein